jgi:hypothetical protein
MQVLWTILHHTIDFGKFQSVLRRLSARIAAKQERIATVERYTQPRVNTTGAQEASAGRRCPPCIHGGLNIRRFDVRRLAATRAYSAEAASAAKAGRGALV